MVSDHGGQFARGCTRAKVITLNPIGNFAAAKCAGAWGESTICGNSDTSNRPPPPIIDGLEFDGSPNWQII